MRVPEFKPVLVDLPSDKYLKPAPLESTVEESELNPPSKPPKTEKQEYHEKVAREQADGLNSLFQRGITLTNNMNGQILTVTLPSAGTEVGIRHNLKITPKYRIILRHRGNGIVIDGPTAWDGSTVYLKASQATENLTITFMVMRE